MGKVGGDFYDIFHMKGGYIGILVADASGHGMPAAFLTALAKISFDEAIQGYLFPADIMRQVNNELITAIKTDDFVTAFFVVISPAFEVFYGNASHQKAIVLRSDGRAIEEWDTNGLFLGALEEANDMYAEGQDVLHYGDRLVMYSDGMIDAKNGSNESFGEARFKNLIKDTADLPLQEAKDRIIAEWDSFTGQMPQTDDATMVIIEIDPAYSRLFEYRDRGFKLLSEKKFDEAIVELKQALEINGMDEKTHLYLGECYLKNGSFEKSVEHLQQYLKNNEVDANVWFHIADAYYKNGKYAMAYKSALMASQLRNSFTDALAVCGHSLMKLDNPAEAVKFWNRILAYDPGNRTAKSELEKCNA